MEKEEKKVFVAANPHSLQPGMTKRFYAACFVIQGMLANESLMKMYARKKPTGSQTVIVKDVYDIVDELIKQEKR